MMTAALLSIALAAGLVTGQFAPQQAASEPLEPQKEAIVQKLGTQLRCAVCQGLSVADSPSSMARAQLDKIRELVAEGKSEQEVIDYFVARYGEWVLLEPPAKGFNWLVWLGPGVLVLIGGFVIYRQLQRGPTETDAGSEQTTPAAPPSSADDADPYLQAVRREMER